MKTNTGEGVEVGDEYTVLEAEVGDEHKIENKEKQ